MRRLSGLQREVLSLYRKCLREVRKKPQNTRDNFRAFAQAEFRKQLDVNKKDFSTIEHLLRKGHKQLETYSSPGIRNIKCSDKMSFYTTTLSPGDFLPLFQLMDDYCDTRRPASPKPAQSSRAKPSAAQSTPVALAPRQLTSFTPRFDVRELEKSYVLDGELPGAQQENIEIEFTDPETIVIKGQIERNYDVAPPSHSTTTDDNDDAMSVHSDGASSTHSNYHAPTVEDEEEDGAVKVSVQKTTNNSVTKQKQRPESAQEPKFKYWASERSIGTFQRTFTFPTRVDQDGVKATFKNGVLSVFVPKQAAQKAKRIRVE
ncbi:heat shock protein, putative [Talaromyces stipitatus ATCC 10500]|uniref:Heat shock protein, putative n=1 Tax=Talaromyces stipitatus (strain ATCC 10500 / CBS 375.48 / QM 6759 / NRRL 1006) TaxID=441959 RepID=B8M7E8_TALSN|nr:heat shock protein, putative [Talaromyces stipitatus ATCC 10500]EED20368.1 heat shock protein, putative [Talaromyces stipitatus ATCC 10500]